MAVIGILGGMGPMATVDLYRKIISNTPAQCDQDHLRIIIDNNPKIPSRINAILKGEESPLPELIRSAQLLASCGVDFIIMPCNTAHFWFTDIQKAVNVELVHMIDNVACYLEKDSPDLSGKMMLLATAATIQTGLYDKAFAAHEMKLAVPSNQEQQIVSGVIEEIKAGHIEDNPYIKQLSKVMNSNYEKGIRGFIGGCTEIPLIFPYISGNFSKYDPTEILAKHAVDKALNS